MGNYFSQKRELIRQHHITAPSSEDDSNFKDLSEITGFTYRQIEQLYSRFKDLIGQRATTGIALLRPTDLYMIPEFLRNPLNKRITDVFFSFAKDQQNMTFEEFLETLSNFRSFANESKSIREEKRRMKLKFMFMIYDTNGTNYLDIHDLMFTLRLALPKGSLSNEMIQQSAAQMLADMDRDGDGVISFDDYCKTLADVDIDSKINLPFLNRRI